MDLEISDKHIEEIGRFEREPPYNSEESVELVTASPSDTDPRILTDGIDRFDIVRESESVYLIHYQGFVAGYARVTAAGIQEFGHQYLAGERGIPDWYLLCLDETPNQRPWWVPDSYNPDRHIECNRCATAVSPPEIITPGRTDGDIVDWLCPDCWADVRD
ncbi:hypothetical protein, partial [Salinadaptatus halalkaliphilus]|uniref:hypothetical protein n=1 Tax=Salinadaptatus halalkaliphilus TaxID=2419781 RepID=UPI001C2C3D48